MRRLLGLLPLALAIGLTAVTGQAHAEGWHSAQPPAPAPPEGQGGVTAPVPLGHIGQISFWAPNRGLLITAGTEVEGGPVHAGLYYYNGLSWRRLSTVCGGSDGRIAWAGENDFWTISDQQAGQQFGGEGSAEAARRDVSLCHFEDGKVVASYAEPIGVPGSYQRMDAAACSGPNDCWFAGEQLPAGANAGAFHLHWNGQTVTPVPSLQTPEPQLEDPPHTVTSLAYFKGHFYESAQIEHIAPNENPLSPDLIHRIVEGSSKPFAPTIVEGAVEEQSLDEAGAEGLQLSGGASQLWAATGKVVLLNTSGQYQQLALEDPEGALGNGSIDAVAAEPESEDAWLSIDLSSGPESGNGARRALARVARVKADGKIEAMSKLPEAGEELAHKGAAGAIDCPAKGDCWLATMQGWLFHLGGVFPEDSDPYFQSLIDYRPADASIPFLAPEDFPEDDSGANPPMLPAPPAPPVIEPSVKVRAPLYSHVKERLVGRATIAISFKLATKSRVRLVAVRGRRTVAQTRRYVFGRGGHTLQLHLNPRAWPTKLQLKVTAIGAVPLVSPGSSAGESSGGPTAVTTALRPTNSASR